MGEESKITAAQVKELREMTGAGMMDCKRALEEAGGDLEKAVQLLREKGFAEARKRQSRTAEQGVVESYIHIGKQIGAMVELNCETDFVARNSEFLELAHQLAMHVAAFNPRYLDRGSVPVEVLEAERERCLEQLKVRLGEGEDPEKSVEEMLDKFFEEVCLLDQPFVKDPSLSVGELISQVSARVGEKIALKRFCRFQVGENGG